LNVANIPYLNFVIQMTHGKVEKKILQWEILKSLNHHKTNAWVFATHIPTNLFVIVKNIKIM
jgi:hypothetical protein